MFQDSSRFTDLIILLLFIILVLSTGGYFFRQGFQGNESAFHISSEPQEVMRKPLDVEEGEEEIIVHLSGAVQRPGVYYLAEGDRVLHLLKRGGGAALDGDLDRLNLAAPLYDGQKVHVPRKTEGENQASSLHPGVEMTAGGKININTSSKQQLETLTGVGPTRAQAILDYREQEGPFSTKEELMNVPGIGEKTFAALKDRITLY